MYLHSDSLYSFELLIPTYTKDLVYIQVQLLYPRLVMGVPFFVVVNLLNLTCLEMN